MKNSRAPVEGRARRAPFCFGRDGGVVSFSLNVSQGKALRRVYHRASRVPKRLGVGESVGGPSLPEEAYVEVCGLDDADEEAYEQAEELDGA